MFSKQGIICMSAEMVDRMDIHGMDKRPKNLTLGNYIEREGTGQRTVNKGKDRSDHRALFSTLLPNSLCYIYTFNSTIRLYIPQW